MNPIDQKIAWLRTQGWKPTGSQWGDGDPLFWAKFKETTKLADLPDPPYPYHTPPEVPNGMEWAYRGTDWRAADAKIVFYAVKQDGSVSGVVETPKVFGSWEFHYFEAVPTKEAERLAKLAEAREKVQQVFEGPLPFAEVREPDLGERLGEEAVRTLERASQPMQFTPLHLRLLFHCYITPETYSPWSDAVANYLAELEDLGAVQAFAGFVSKYRTTELGEAWVRMLCNTQPPRMAFLDAAGREIRND